MWITSTPFFIEQQKVWGITLIFQQAKALVKYEFLALGEKIPNDYIFSYLDQKCKQEKTGFKGLVCKAKMS